LYICEREDYLLISRILRIELQAIRERQRIEKEMVAEKNKWMSESRKAILADEAERLKEYERVQIEEARIKSEQLRAVGSYP